MDFYQVEYHLHMDHSYMASLWVHFFLTWFFGSLYISKLSDSIGRKAGILICLLGAIIGYAVAVIAIILHSFTLLVASRAITPLLPVHNRLLLQQ